MLHIFVERLREEIYKSLIWYSNNITTIRCFEHFYSFIANGRRKKSKGNFSIIIIVIYTRVIEIIIFIILIL